MEKNMEAFNNERSINIIFVTTAAMSIAVIGAMVAMCAAAPPVGTVAEAFCSAWSFGIPKLGQIITGVLVANLLVWTGVLVAGLACLGLDGISRKTGKRESATDPTHPNMPIELAA